MLWPWSGRHLGLITATTAIVWAASASGGCSAEAPSEARQEQASATTRAPGDPELVQVIGRDDIPALLSPSAVDRDIADSQMRDDEPVLGVSVNGEHRAYSLPFLTQHEIANDVLGGEPIAVTW